MRKITGYYEPVVDVRAAPAPGFSEPFLPRPTDLVGIDLAAFDEAQDLSEAIAEDVRKGLSNDMAEPLKVQVQESVDARLERRFSTPIWGQLTPDRRVRPYPPRKDLAHETRPALAWAHPADVYDVQVQGSARVRFEDGRMHRMAYDSQNGWRWNSAWACLRDQGAIAAVDKRAARAWMDANGPDAARAALACDPSYVFFALEPIPDPGLGPKGAQGVPLTALGSIAVDPAAHPYGAVLFVAGEGPGPTGALGPQARLFVAQDTGGAIRRGPMRGDIFYGTGEEAGARAMQQNAEAEIWTLLPAAAGTTAAALK
jgi:membrane-bound lytic murein transglycosylase A